MNAPTPQPRNMSAIAQTLSNYSDRELAFLYTFQLSKYLPETQSEVLNYIQIQRGLDLKMLEEVVHNSSLNAENEANGICPRCSSAKLLVEQSDSTESIGVKQQKITCEVCCYKLSDPESDKSSLLGHLLDILPGL